MEAIIFIVGLIFGTGWVAFLLWVSRRDYSSHRKGLPWKNEFDGDGKLIFRKAPDTSLSRSWSKSHNRSKNQTKIIKKLSKGLPGNAKKIFELLPQLKEDVRHRAMAALLARSIPEQLDLWIQYFPDYDRLNVKYLLKFTRKHFSQEQAHLLAFHSAIPDIKEWYQEKKLETKDYVDSGSLEIVEFSQGEIQEVKGKAKSS